MPNAGARLPQYLPAKEMCIAAWAMPAALPFPVVLVRAAGAHRLLEEMPVESCLVLAAVAKMGN